MKEEPCRRKKHIASSIHWPTGSTPNQAKSSGDSPLCSAPVIRALFLASAALSDAGKARSGKSANRPGKAGTPWTAEEDAELAAAFDGGAPVRELADKHQRSTGGIRSRLIHLGRISEGAQAR